MAFVQIIEFTTTDFEAVRKVDAAWEKATEGTRTARRQIVTRDRHNPDHYMSLVFFDSYESAMENSQLSATQEFSGKYEQATDAISFHDLDVVSDSEL